MKFFYNMFSKVTCGIALFAFAFVVLAAPVSAFAQADTKAAPVSATPVPSQDGQVACFDYYHFGSVQADIAPQNIKTISGSTQSFTGYLHNKNAYPIINAGVYVKIFRKGAGTDAQTNGFELVDQFFAKEGMDLPANSSTPLSFKWAVPAFAPTGDYMIATYVASDYRYNLSGLSFTDDITGNTANFSVVGEVKEAVHFDKSSVKVTDQSATQNFSFAAFTPKVDKASPVTISFNLKNSTAKKANAAVTYKLYSWDGLRSQSQIASKTEYVNVEANKSVALSYTVTDTSKPVYYLVVESKVNDVKSVIDVRFVRDGVDAPRVNFPSVGAYPLQKDTPIALFACLHNAGLAKNIPDGKLVLTLTDKDGGLIDSYTYTGTITGQMMGVAKKITPKETYTDFTLSSELYSGQKLIDSSKVQYSCSKLDPNACTVAAAAANEKSTSMLTYIVIVLAALAIIAALLSYRGRLHRSGANTMLMLFVIASGFGVYQSNISLTNAGDTFSATSTINNTAILPANAVQGNIDLVPGSALTFEPSGTLDFTHATTSTLWRDGQKNIYNPSGFHYMYSSQEKNGDGATALFINGIHLQYSYGVQVTEASSSQVYTSGASIPLGTVVRVTHVPFANQHAAWFLTGNSNDSPYVYWNTGAGASTASCNTSDQFSPRLQFLARFPGRDQTGRETGDNAKSYFHAYLPVVLEKPNVTIDTVGSTAGITKQADGSYKIDSAGTIVFNANFATTTGKAYMQFKGYFDEDDSRNVPQNPGFPYGICKTVKTYGFSVPALKNVVTLNASGDNIVNTPGGLTGSRPRSGGTSGGDCVDNNPTLTFDITPANPVSSKGGTVYYEYQIDNGSGFGDIVRLADGVTSFTQTWTTSGTKIVRVRANNGVSVSSWISLTKNLNGCIEVANSCTDDDYGCSAWGTCAANGKQTRTCNTTTSTSCASVAGYTPATSRDCNYVPPPVTCSVGGVTLQENQSKVFYKIQRATIQTATTPAQTCGANAQSRTCLATTTDAGDRVGYMTGDAAYGFSQCYPIVTEQ